MDFEIIYFLTKIVFGGILCFLAILLLSRNRDSEWMSLVIACLSNYFFTVLELLVQYGLLKINHNYIEILFETGKIIIPSLFVIIALIIKLVKTKKFNS